MRPPVTLGQNIKRLRIAAGFKTQGALAAALGVPQPQVSDWENDRYDMLDTKTLMRLGKKLRVSMDAILKGLDADYDLVCENTTIDVDRADYLVRDSKNEELARIQSPLRTSLETRHGHRPVQPTTNPEGSDVARQLAELRGIASELSHALIDLRAVSEAVTSRAAGYVATPDSERSPVDRLAAAKPLGVRAPRRSQHKKKSAGSRR